MQTQDAVSALNWVDQHVTDMDDVEKFSFTEDKIEDGFYHVSFVGSRVPPHVKQLLERDESHLVFIKPDQRVRIKTHVLP